MPDYTDNATCPYCGYEDTNFWEYDGDSGHVNCQACGREYFYEIVISTTCSTVKPKSGDNNND